MSEEIARRDGGAVEQRESTPAEQVIALVRRDTFKAQIADALPNTVPPERFVRATVTALLEKPDIATAERTSLITALLKCAADGLVPDGRQAAINVYSGKAQYLPMIGGLRDRLAEFGWTLVTRVIYANDEFEHVQGTREEILHRPPRPGMPRGARIGAYAIARHRDGRVITEVMDPERIAKSRDMAKTKNVWDKWTDAMWEKTVGKRLAKKLGLSDSTIVRIADQLDQPEPDVAGLLYSGAVSEPPVAGLAEPSPASEHVDDAEPNPPSGEATFDDVPVTFEPEPDIAPAPARVTVDPLLLAAARQKKPPYGTYQQYTLEQIGTGGEGAEPWLRQALERFPEEEPAFGRYVWAFCRADFPHLVDALEAAA